MPFYSGSWAFFAHRLGLMVKIILNGEEREVEGDTLLYSQIAEVVGVKYPTITFRQAPITTTRRNGEGSLLVGQALKVQDGTIINAVDTGNA